MLVDHGVDDPVYRTIGISRTLLAIASAMLLLGTLFVFAMTAGIRLLGQKALARGVGAALKAVRVESIYRPDIDGLRAVAVLAVFAFHLEVNGFQGGFVRVDIFFVISGHLISSLILREIAYGTFSWRHFIARRVRRIVPAQFAVIAVTIRRRVFFICQPSWKR